MGIFGHMVRPCGQNYSVIQFLFFRSSSSGLMSLSLPELPTNMQTTKNKLTFYQKHPSLFSSRQTNAVSCACCHQEGGGKQAL